MNNSKKITLISDIINNLELNKKRILINFLSLIYGYTLPLRVKTLSLSKNPKESFTNIFNEVYKNILDEDLTIKKTDNKNPNRSLSYTMELFNLKSSLSFFSNSIFASEEDKKILDRIEQLEKIELKNRQEKNRIIIKNLEDEFIDKYDIELIAALINCVVLDIEFFKKEIKEEREEVGLFNNNSNIKEFREIITLNKNLLKCYNSKNNIEHFKFLETYNNFKEQEDMSIRKLWNNFIENEIDKVVGCTDIEDNYYSLEKFNNRTWTTSNLNVSRFRNGDQIKEVNSNEEWIKSYENKDPAWCYYDNDPKNGEKYGKLYNWYCVKDARGLAPAGYHVPSDAEWTVLTNFLGGEDLAGQKMKSTTGWSNNGHGTNSSGFNGLPGGSRIEGGNFLGITEGGSWWSSSEESEGYAWNRHLEYYDETMVNRNTFNNYDGLSVRCIKD